MTEPITDETEPLSREVHEALYGLQRNGFRHDLFREIMDERQRQLYKWGDQSRELGSYEAYKTIADRMRDSCNEAEAAGDCTWRHITLEEVWEAFSEEDRHRFRVEAIQTMAVLFSALEDLFRDEFTS